MLEKRSPQKLQTIVVKIGSSILSSSNEGLNKRRINALAKELAKLKEKIPNIIIVSSGAVASGFKTLNLKTRPKDMVTKQVCAAVGQAKLILAYEQAFNKFKLKVAQLLLTKDDLAKRKYFNAAYNTLKKLLEFGIIPIINENDSIITNELKYIESFGDNDNLAALVAGIIEADLLLILSDVLGLYTANPKLNKKAKRISTVTCIDKDLLSLAKDNSSELGTGGMYFKLNAAKKALSIGCEVAIISGLKPKNINLFFEGKDIGTYFKKSKSILKKRKFWLQFATIPKGKLLIDEGAKKALLANKSLLAKGVKAYEGKFKAGDIVIICDLVYNELAYAKIAYSWLEVEKIMGHNSEQIFEILGYKTSDELVHIDDLALIKQKNKF